MPAWANNKEIHTLLGPPLSRQATEKRKLGRPCKGVEPATTADRGSKSTGTSSSKRSNSGRHKSSKNNVNSRGCVSSWRCSSAPPPCHGRTPVRHRSDHSCWSNAAQEGRTIYQCAAIAGPCDALAAPSLLQDTSCSTAADSFWLASKSHNWRAESGIGIRPWRHAQTPRHGPNGSSFRTTPRALLSIPETLFST